MIYNYQGNGIIFKLSSLEESIVYSYANPSDLVFNTDDYGVITELHTESINYGNFSPAAEGEDQGLIIISDSVQPFGGLTFSGSANTEWINKNFYGAGEYKVAYNSDNTSGTLFSFGEKVESRTYDYNVSSVEDTLSDYGLISNPAIFIEDLGFTSSVSGPTEEFGSIANTIENIINPFGGLTLSGFSSNNLIFVYQDFVTSGTIIKFGTLSDERIVNDYAASGNINLGKNIGNTCSDSEQFGSSATTFDSTLETFDVLCDVIVFSSALEAYSAQTPEDTILCEFDGNLIESRTYDYSESSIQNALVDYGLISNSSIFIEDYQSVTNDSGSTEDFNLITDIVSGNVQPFGGLTLSGSSSNNLIFVYQDFVTSGTIIKFGTLSDERIVNDYAASGNIGLGKDTVNICNGSEQFNSSTVTFDSTLETFDILCDFIVFSSALEAYSAQTPEDTVLYEFDGNLIESRTYDYNESSIQNELVDYGLISNSSIFIEDYQSVTNDSGSIEDFNLITDIVSGNTQPFGGLTLSGSALTQPNYRLFLSGESIIKLTYNPDNTSGTLFAFGEKLESITYDYNSSSISENNLDYGLITSLQLGIPDYGFITGSSGTQPSENYGLVIETVQTEVLTPFGLSLFSGSALEAYSAQTPEDTQLFTISGSALEKETDSYVGLETLTLSGSALENDVDSYVGTGTLFGFGEKLESITYDYNQYSILTDPLQDYGLVSAESSESLDYGMIISAIDDGIDKYGSVTGNPFDPTPFGSILISGSISESFNESPYTTSGSITIFGDSTTEKFTANIPDNTQLFQISGSALTSDIDVYIGIGTLFNFGEKLESITYDYNESSISDNEDDFGLISDSNSQFSDYGLITGSGGTQPDENYGLITEIITNSSNNPFGSLFISGTLIEKETDSYVGLGTLTLSGSLVERETDSYVGLGTIIKFEILSERVVNSYSASGTINLGKNIVPVCSVSEQFGSSTTTFDSTSLTFDILCDSTEVVFSSALESFSAQTPDNTVLYTFSGSSLEAYSAQTPEDTQLFIISGTLAERESDSYVGLGTLTLSGSALEAYSAQIPEDTVLYEFDGNLFESRTYDYNEFSILTFDQLDYGFISQLPDQFDEDYVFISNPANSNINNGILVGFGATETILPFGTIEIFGVSSDLVITNSYVGLGTLTLSGSSLEKETDSYDGLGTLTLSGSALENDVDSYVGLGTLTLSGSALEAYSAQTPEDTQLFIISGSALEAYSAQTPEDTQLFIISGSALEKETDSYDGLGTLSVFGELIHPNIDYTPHYGIEQNIGIGTTGIQFSGDGLSGKVGFYNGIGNATLSGSALESYSAQTPEDTVLYVFNGNARTYSPIYPRNAIPGDPGSGIGTIRINDDAGLTITRAVLPYFGRGTIFLNGIGLESFSIVNYDGSGVFTFSGISSNREINVYQDYVTSGSIFVSQQTQPIIEKNTNSYIGVGNIIKFGTLSERVVNSYSASGTINLGKTAPADGTGIICSDSEQFGSSTTTFDSTLKTFDVLCDSTQVIFSSALESFSAQTPEDTQLFTISGSALEAYSAQTPEDSVLYEFDGNLIESRTYAEEGSGQLTFGSDAFVIFEPRVFGTGLFRFITHLSDNLYDTCDSVDVTSDYENSAFVSFTVNPPKSTQLFNILGSASTNEINAYEYVGVGNLTFSGSLVERESDSYAGIGTLFTLSGGSETDVNSYRGSGSLFAISGSSESKSSQIPENTILVNISGTASTKLESEYSYSGIGTAYINGSALIVFESDYPYSGVGSIALSGELVHPDIQFIPAPKGVGLFALSGISSNSISRIGVLSGNKTLFAFSGGFESFSRSTYIGLGTIYIQEVSGIAINNPFQIPRTYVVII